MTDGNLLLSVSAHMLYVNVLIMKIKVHVESECFLSNLRTYLRYEMVHFKESLAVLCLYQTQLTQEQRHCVCQSLHFIFYHPVFGFMGFSSSAGVLILQIITSTKHFDKDLLHVFVPTWTLYMYMTLFTVTDDRSTISWYWSIKQQVPGCGSAGPAASRLPLISIKLLWLVIGCDSVVSDLMGFKA